jgi:ketosteroid isomerase-like protein
LRIPRLLLLVLVFATCAKPPPPKRVLIEDDPPDPTGQVKKLLKDAYGAIEALEPERLEKLLTTDVVAFGFGASDFFSQPGPILEHLRQELLPFGLRGDTLKVISSKPRVGIAEGGQSAWLHDLPRFERIRQGGKSQYWSPRVTAHLIKSGKDSWQLDAVHVSFGFPDAELYAAGSERRLLAPVDPGTAKGPDSEQLIGLTRRLLDDLAVKVARISDRDEVALLGTDPTDVFEGGKAFKELVKPQLAQIKKSNTFVYKIDGGPRAKLAAGLKSGWVVATVTLRVGEGKKARTLVPFRALWIYAEEGGVWNLVSDHQSLGLKNEQRTATKEEDLSLPEAADAGHRDAGSR